jgi:hypothetical protein
MIDGQTEQTNISDPQDSELTGPSGHWDGIGSTPMETVPPERRRSLRTCFAAAAARHPASGR